jgi:hypothetical protein
MTIPVLWMERHLLTKMICKKCQGRVMIDRSFGSSIHVELYCLCCGNRWSLRHPNNRGEFAKWIHKKEQIFLHQSSMGF